VYFSHQIRCVVTEWMMKFIRHAQKTGQPITIAPLFNDWDIQWSYSPHS